MANTSTERDPTFVSRERTELRINGQRFGANGANNFWLADVNPSQHQVDALFDIADELGLGVIRTWMHTVGERGESLQPRPGDYNETAFRHLDHVIEVAARHEIKLIFAWADNWDHYGGMPWYVEQSPTAEEKDDFYTDEHCRTWYRQFVRYCLERENSITGIEYRNDPTILCWELANEPRCPSDPSGETLQAWLREMGSFVKDIDDNHLLSTGIEGFSRSDPGWMGQQGTDFVDNHTIDEIDICTFHLYPDHWELSLEESIAWIRSRHEIGYEEIEKPVYLGEFGWQGTDEDRAGIYRLWYDALVDSGGIMPLVWQVVSGGNPDHDDGFWVWPEDKATLSLIQSVSDLFNAEGNPDDDSVAESAGNDEEDEPNDSRK